MVTDPEIELVEKRMEAFNENFRIACLQQGSFTKDEILEHLKAKDETGREITEILMSYMKKLKERR